MANARKCEKMIETLQAELDRTKAELEVLKDGKID